jgi:hypothetical protein
VQDTNGILQRKEKKHGEEGERNIIIRETGMPDKKWKDERRGKKVQNML